MSNKTYIIILFVAILSLGIVTKQRINDFVDSLGKFNLPEINMPELNLNEYFKQDEEGYSEWVSEDESLKITYPASWSDITSLLDMVPEEAGLDIEDSNVLFWAQNIDTESQEIMFLTVLGFDNKETIESMTEKIESDFGEQEKTAQIELISKEEYSAILEIIPETEDGDNFCSEVKLLFGENKTYAIIFTAPQDKWEISKDKAVEIFDSVIFTPIDKTN